MKVFFLLIFLVFQAEAKTRIENEYKLKVPAEKVNEVWSYLSKRFSQITKPGIKKDISIEYFTDIYFDTPDLILALQENSLRRRIRLIPETPEHLKNGRSLIQFKFSEAGKSLLSRKEMKFQVKEKMKNAHYGTHPDLIMRDEDKILYFDTLKKLGIKEPALRASLVLNQKRSRVYVSFNNKPFATVTLDEAHSTKLWVTEKFNEIEIELDENLYTVSTPVERALMQTESDEIKKELEAALPYVSLDLTPKYNKMLKLFQANMPWYSQVITIEAWFH